MDEKKASDYAKACTRMGELILARDILEADFLKAKEEASKLLKELKAESILNPSQETKENKNEAI